MLSREELGSLGASSPPQPVGSSRCSPAGKLQTRVGRAALGRVLAHRSRRDMFKCQGMKGPP